MASARQVGASWPTSTRAPSARRASTARESLASDPETDTPRASRMRAIPLIPAPPMPMRWTRSPSPGTRPRCRHDRAATTSSTRRARRSSASAWPEAARRLARRLQPGRVAQQRHQLRQHPLGGQLGVGDQHAAPGCDDRLGVERLLAVAVRQRDVHRGQADGRHLGDGHRPRPAQDGVGGGVGQVHVLDVGAGAGSGTRRRRCGLGRRAGGPWACSTRSPPRRAPAGPRRRRRSATRAPCEPPKTSSTGPSAGRPKCARAAGRRASRSSVVTDRRSGIPSTSACGNPLPGTAAATRAANRAPTLFASPARALASCTTIGVRPRAARYAGSAT